MTLRLPGLAVLLLSGVCVAQIPVALPPTTSPAGVTPTATLADAQAAFAQADYRGALAKIAAAMPISLPDKQHPDQRYDLLILRGECFLHLKQRLMAIDAFNYAARVTDNVNQIAYATGVTLLIKASPDLVFSAGDAKYDIVDPKSRTEALKLLFNQRLQEDQADVAKALKDTTLVPTHELLPKLGDLYSLELAATGDTKQTTDISAQVSQHAQMLIDKELARLGRRIGDLVNLASEPITTENGWSARGLFSPEQNEVKQDIAYLGQIRDVADRARRISERFNHPTEGWEAILDRTDDILSRANLALAPR